MLKPVDHSLVFHRHAAVDSRQAITLEWVLDFGHQDVHEWEFILVKVPSSGFLLYQFSLDSISAGGRHVPRNDPVRNQIQSVYRQRNDRKFLLPLC